MDKDGTSLSYNLRFPGQYYDVETQKHYNFNRDYNPMTGRYVQSDPIGLDGGNNTYGYVAGNPMGNVDPFGLYPIHDPSYPLDVPVWIDVAGPPEPPRDAKGFLHNVNILRELEALPYGGTVFKAGIFVGIVGKAVTIPGRVISRINVSSWGMAHVIRFHLNPAKLSNKSQFILSESELRLLFGARSTVLAPVRALETGNYARTITTNRTVGILAEKMGGTSTNTFTIITDKYGNLMSAFPGGL